MQMRSLQFTIGLASQSEDFDTSAAHQAGTLQQSSQSYTELGPGLLT